MSVTVKCLSVGELETNCYIVVCDRTHEAIVIDPGADASAILSMLKSLGVRCRYIINTHGHADHIGANGAVKEATGAQIAIHRKDAGSLQSPQGNLSTHIWPDREGIVSPPADVLLEDRDVLHFGDLALRVIHTPGHTPGGICLLIDGVVFTGDTLFNAGIGRTDIPGGNSETLARSLEERVLQLPGDTVVYPGHGPMTTIAREVEYWSLAPESSES